MRQFSPIGTTKTEQHDQARGSGQARPEKLAKPVAHACRITQGEQGREYDGRDSRAIERGNGNAGERFAKARQMQDIQNENAYRHVDGKDVDCAVEIGGGLDPDCPHKVQADTKGERPPVKEEVGPCRAACRTKCRLRCTPGRPVPEAPAPLES